MGAGNGVSFRSFAEALMLARSLKLKNEKGWREWCKGDARPADIPTNPNRTYKACGWKGKHITPRIHTYTYIFIFIFIFISVSIFKLIFIFIWIWYLALYHC